MLRIGIDLGFGKLHPNLSDQEMDENELDLAVRAEGLGGMPYDQARAGLELFAHEVLPKARGLRVARERIGA